MIQSRGINDHKRLRFIPHYLALLDSKYIRDLGLFLAEMSHFSDSHSFITHSLSSIPLSMIPAPSTVLHTLACMCVIPCIHLPPNRYLGNVSSLQRLHELCGIISNHLAALASSCKFCLQSRLLLTS